MLNQLESKQNSFGYSPSIHLQFRDYKNLKMTERCNSGDSPDHCCHSKLLLRSLILHRFGKYPYQLKNKRFTLILLPLRSKPSSLIVLSVPTSLFQKEKQNKTKKPHTHKKTNQNIGFAQLRLVEIKTSETESEIYPSADYQQHISFIFWLCSTTDLITTSSMRTLTHALSQVFKIDSKACGIPYHLCPYWILTILHSKFISYIN